jgi:FtsH-binding integral membrane protein
LNYMVNWLKYTKMKTQKVKSAFHLFAGVTSLFHALQVLEKGRSDFSFFFMVTGAVFILLAVTSADVRKRYLFHGGIFFLIESLVMALVARDFFTSQIILPGYLFVVIAVCYLLMAVINIRNANKNGGGASSSGPGVTYKCM